MSKDRNLQISPPADELEAVDFAKLACQALFFQPADLDAWIKAEGLENVRLVRVNGKLAGGLVRQPMGQWFGGKSVPMAGIRMVAVAPEHRAGGIGSQLMQATLEELHREGIPLSTLYPATQPVYRRQGYEQAGTRLCYRIPARGIDLRDRTLTLRKITESDMPQVREVYARRAKRTAGNLDRSEWLWARIFNPPAWFSPMYGYLVERDGELEGYLVYSQKLVTAPPHDNEVTVEDFVALTADAGRRLLTFLADHRSVAEHVSFWGAPADPLLYLPSEQTFKITDRLDWMLRLVDVRAALMARGYPAGLTAELHLDVRDDVLPANNGHFVLHVADSRGQVAKGGRGELCIDVRGLAALYSGHLSPGELQATGYLEGGEHALACAGSIFAGPAPWMSDIF